MVSSPAGALWVLGDNEQYSLAESWNLMVPEDAFLKQDEELVAFFIKRDWVVDTQELRSNPGKYDNLGIPEWIDELSNQDMLILPLFFNQELLGVMMLVRPLGFDLTWEDTDLLRTVSTQVATHVAEFRAQRLLAESSQFEAFNRLVSFIMHDLKNLIAQQSLVVKNAAKHKDNPEFVEDAIQTIDNSVNRMNNLLTQLRPEHQTHDQGPVRLNTLIPLALKKLPDREPKPVFDGAAAQEAWVKVDPARFFHGSPPHRQKRSRRHAG